MRILRFILLLSLLLGMACQKGEVQQEERSIPVNVLVLKPNSIQSTVEITGNLEALNDALVISKVSEELKQIVRPVGSSVRAGEVIVKLDDSMLLQAKKQAEAALSSARARYQNVKQDFERYRRLYKQKAISLQQWQKMKTTMQEVQAALDQAQAAAAQANEQFENSRIKAPFDGVVGSIFFDVGQLVPVGQPVVKIINPKLMKAKLYVPDQYFQKIQKGQSVLARFPALGGRQFSGRIVKIDPAIDPMSRTFAVEVQIPNEEQLLTSGLYGLFKIILAVHDNVVVIPDNAVISQTSVQVDPESGKPSARRQYFAFVIDQGRAKLTKIEQGLSSGDFLEITQGLSFGDSLIVVGQRLLKEGQKVKVVEAY